MKLRDALLAPLATLPGARQSHVHVLTSSPRKHSGLFPYASPRPKVYLQDILILLSEQQSSGTPRVLVTAIEANVYVVPATSCGILYVSKVDSTGQGVLPSPTPTLVKALMTFYADPETRPIAADTLWIQLFARAQGQYLFPNSSEFSGKHPLSDVKLCAWWRKVFTDVALGLEARTGGHEGTTAEGKARGMVTSRLYYVLPGYSELEAIQSLKLPFASQSTSKTPQWTYGHPYSQKDIPLPCPPNANGPSGLGYYIPSFDDDPKSRFIDEIALATDTNSIKSPKKKRPKTTLRRSSSKANGQLWPSGEESKQEQHEKRDDKERGDDEEITQANNTELDKVSPEEFWERMSFRQECVTGAVTGFFAFGLSRSPPHSSPSDDPHDKSGSDSSPLVMQPGQVSARLIRRVVASLMTGHEFSTTERTIRATQVLEEAIRGLCEDIATVPAPSTAIAPAETTNAHSFSCSSASTSSCRDAVTPEREMDDHDRDPEVERNGLPVVAPSDSSEAPRTPPPCSGKSRISDASSSSSPLREPVTSLETYHSHIYGSVTVDNPPLPSKSSTASNVPEKAKPVTVLAVRKKRKPGP